MTPAPRTAAVRASAAPAVKTTRTTVAAAGDVAATAAKVALGTIITAFIRFLSALRGQHQGWLRDELGRYSTNAQDIAQVIAEEMVREDAFAKNSADRVAQQMPIALAIADPVEREKRVKQILADEERFAQQRADAMAARAISALERLQLRRDSPLGAYWELGHAHKHTRGCLIMAGRFWPWSVLDRLHPPRHYGCTSRLRGYADAILAGLMSPSDVPDERAAIRASIGVVMEAEEAEGLIRELELREQLVGLGVSADALGDIAMEGVTDGATAPAQAAE